MNAIVKTIPIEQQPISESSALMRVIETAALREDFDVDKLQKLLDVKKDWEANEARKAFVAAMAAFKADAPTIVKDKRVEFSGTKYTHASIGNVVGVVCAALGRHGLSHRWDTKQENGLITVTCVITHQLGHSESVSLSGKPDDSGKKNAIQQTASTVSYLQRYTLLSATGLATIDQEDDDGVSAAKSPEDLAAEEEKRKQHQSWIDAIRSCTDITELNKRKKELVAACGGADVVPRDLMDECIAAKARIDKAART